MTSIHNYELAARGCIVFCNRREAGEALGEELSRRGLVQPIILGLTRGGVPVAAEVATALDAPLDAIVVKKLRAPLSPELAIGAICSDGTRVLQAETIRLAEAPQAYLDREIAIRMEEAGESESRYRGGHPAVEVAGRLVVIVDDGVATGSSLKVAIESVRARGADAIVVAVPVGSVEAYRRLQRRADDVVCLETPADFWAVGQFYGDFSPVDDATVTRLLAESRGDREAMIRMGGDLG